MSSKRSVHAGWHVPIIALTFLGCGPSPYYEIIIECDGCEAAQLYPGDELTFTVDWRSQLENTGFDADYEAAWYCDPFAVSVACAGAACETTRNHPSYAFWSLEESSAAESQSTFCVSPSETFKVRPIGEGDLVVTVELEHHESEERSASTFGPFGVTAPEVSARIDCGALHPIALDENECAHYRDIAVGTRLGLRARWDGKAGRQDPILRQPYRLHLDCGDVACETRIGPSLNPDIPPFGTERVFEVEADPPSAGLFIDVRATEPGLLNLTARFEHLETGVIIDHPIAALPHRSLDGITLLCLEGELCGDVPDGHPRAIVGVLGMSEGRAVLAVPDEIEIRRASEQTEDDCHIAEHIEPDGTPGWSCQLQVLSSSEPITVRATVGGHVAELLLDQ